MIKRVPFHLILAAQDGDSEALNAILRHYEGYISTFSKRSLIDEYGNQFDVIDEDMKQRIVAKLMFQIIYKFDSTKLPCDGKLER